ncbi:MAG: GtrA family protein [Bacteroidetes bacterium]|nr:GtrA family protein [Bacteroidales bacterium]MBU1010522.1 GtrA family protein [Bacteroidota bacterium]
MITKFIKFGVVGFSGLIVDFGTTFLCKEILKIQQYVSNAIGFMLAASSNYYLNRIWTFESANPNVMIEYSEFILISLIGLAINTVIIWLLVSRLKMNFYLSKVFAVGVVTVWNFFANLAFTFVSV